MYKYIIHLADIHIRTGNKEYSRYDEYLNVFINLEKSIKEKLIEIKNENSTLIMIAGDIFHNKNKIENYGLKLFNIFINILKNLAPVIIIPGNHDYLQQFPNDPGLLDSSLNNLNNIYFLNKTENIVLKNLGITTISINDTLKEGETFGIKEKLPEFPINFNKDIKYIIGIFHGSFGKTYYNENKEVEDNNSYPLDMLNNLDIAILGDIHLRQKSKHNDCHYGYSGSLIQQNYGETIIDHGYILWNIETKETEFINIYNNFGFVYISYINNKWHIKYKNKYIDIIEIINNKYFPKNIKFRIEKDYINLNDLYDIFKKYNIYAELENTNTFFNNKILNNIIKIPEIDFNDIKYYIQFIKKSDLEENIINKSIDLINNPDSLLLNNNEIPINLLKKIKERNIKIEIKINEFKKSLEINNSINKKIFDIIDIHFENCLCYGLNNYINFNKFENNIVLINGNNGSGKSALYEIICYAIWGKPIPSRHSKNSSSSFINTYKKSKCFTNINIKINNTIYNIYREYYQKNNKLNLEIKNSIIKFDNETINGNKAIENWLDNNIGTIDEFLKTSMITQDLDNNYLDMEPKKFKETIDENMGIISINKFKDLIHETSNAYKDIIEHLDTILNTKDENKLTKINENIINNLLNEISKYENEINSINKRNDYLSIDYNIYPKEKFKENIELIINNIILPNSSLNELNEELIFIKNKLKNINIEEYNSKYSNNILNEYNNLIEPIKPSISKDYLNKLYNEIKNIKKPSEINESYNEINNKIIEYEKLINLHNVNKPNKPNNKIIKYYNSLNEINNIINNKFININKCIEIIENNSNPKKLNNKNFNINNLDLLNLENLKLENNKYEKDIIELNYELKIIESNIENNNDKINKLDKINKPKISLDILKNDLKQIKKFNKDFLKYKNELENNTIIINNLNKLKNDLTKYEKLEYNNNCECCMKRDDVNNKINIEKSLNEIITLNNISQINNRIIFLENWFDNYYKLDTENNIKEKIEIIKKYEIYINNIKNYNDNIKNYKIKLININNNIKLLKDKIINNNNNINIIENIISYAYYYYEQYSLLLYENWIIEYDNITFNIKFNKDLLNKILIWNNYKENIYPKIKEYDIIKLEHENYDNFIKKKIELENIINSNKYINIINNIELYNKYNYYKEIIKLKPIHNEKEKNINRIYNLNKELNKLQINYDNSIINNKNYEIQFNEINQINLIKDKLINIKNIIKNIENIHNKYIDWLYTNYIIPNIINLTNQLILKAKHKLSNPIELNLIYDNSLIYLKINKDISIQKASGFQKFIISLALKLAIPKLQSKYSKCNQLFLDEGWTSADSNNRNTIPTFLKELLNEFNTIILASHLNEIKENVDIKLNINKIDNYSQIYYK
jgi:DNA repair exonuclease SbcCD ATPase subunit/DNA repair exonuclease SbcCD nuclease subunit